jgi:hypothetical protein
MTDLADAEHPVLDRPALDRPAFALAALNLGAGVIHLMMAPVHAAVSQGESISFAVAGWAQVAIAVMLLLRPSRRWLQAGIVVNALAIAAWGLSRTRGLPFGERPWTREAVGGVDLVTVLFESAAVVGAAAVLWPKQRLRVPAVASVGVAVAALALTTAVLVNPQTADHHGSTASAAPRRCDQDLNPVSFWREASMAGTLAATSASTALDHHGAPLAGAPTVVAPVGPLQGRGSARLDALRALAAKPGEGPAGQVVANLADLSDAEYDEFVLSMNPANGGADHHGASATTAAPGATGAAGEGPAMSHLGPQSWTPMTNPQLCDQLRSELDRARTVAERYPTAADAVADGYVRVTYYLPGIASHWMKFANVDGVFDVNAPEMLLYDGNETNARLVGLSYYVRLDGDAEPSQGFTGPNDHYHRHIGLCVSSAGVVGDSTTTDEECARRGGRKSKGGNGWMSHAWVVPGCESPWGVFSGVNPLLDRQLAEQSGQNTGNCSASAVRDRYNLTPGSAKTALGS